MRTEKEIFELMLDNKHLFEIGICTWSFRLNIHGLISNSEYLLLVKYMEKNRPSKYSSISAFRSRGSSFYWAPHKIKPRIKWINQQIKKL
jgi:hypothetical protein